MRRAGVPAGPVNSIGEAFTLAEELGLEPHRTVDLGDRSIPQVSSPLRMSATPVRYDLPLHRCRSTSVPERFNRDERESHCRADNCRCTPFVDALLNRLRDGAVIVDPTALRTYECDGLTGFRVVPRAVVLAETTEDVRHAVLTCRDFGVPYVARGAGTGLSGGRCRRRTASSSLCSGCGRSSKSIHAICAPSWNRASPTSISPRPLPHLVCTSRPIHLANRSAPSEATSRRIPAAPTASNTGSPCTTCSNSRLSCPMGRWLGWGSQSRKRWL